MIPTNGSLFFTPQPVQIPSALQHDAIATSSEPTTATTLTG
jgi:hypothetical protein